MVGSYNMISPAFAELCALLRGLYADLRQISAITQKYHENLNFRLGSAFSKFDHRTHSAQCFVTLWKWHRYVVLQNSKKIVIFFPEDTCSIIRWMLSGYVDLKLTKSNFKQKGIYFKTSMILLQLYASKTHILFTMLWGWRYAQCKCFSKLLIYQIGRNEMKHCYTVVFYM